MSYRILLPLDGSTEGEQALHYTRKLARRTEVSVQLLRCYQQPSEVYLLPQLENLAADVLAEHNLANLISAYLDSQAEKLEGIACSTLVRCGDPASEILNQAPEADLVVMSRYGRGGLGRWLLGGVTTKVARSSPTPVLVVPGEGTQEPRLQRIMVCLDGSEVAEQALQVAATLATRVGAELFLYRFVPLVASVDPDSELLEAKEYVQKRQDDYGSLVSDIIVQPGAMHNHIVTSAQELDMDLVVVGSHGRQGLARLLLGSTAEHVLHYAHCPVMVVHQPTA